ncbi:hypothetical protein M407DRAFT_22809 [Tulasnella calospora MUT 4182]|uniref:Nucleolar 27S pre-rRNA processing Urb2/Npa2 C-terminal domain-containing protein n=1 Tax=Tulasnella calospora MUT 4182 TaxID=1051891 RepID=A0A0C3QKJ3_9AGAM|nr:hypothetical protein M407DRAFT_22809 [Tulasnella calospora MUT 4182]
MDPGKSSEAFIKALKGKDTSTSKIELATEGWHSEALYLPGKHSVIADWVIQSLCDPGSDSRLSPLTEARHWQLLADIITSQDTKSTNSWLATILARRTILPVISSTIPKLRSSPDIVAPFAIVYRHVLPLALPKATDEFVLNCFWAPLDNISSDSTLAADPLINGIWTRGLEAFRSKFGQVKDKKRIISAFLDERLGKWARVIQLATLSDELRVALRTAGEILLFGTTEGLLLVMEQPSDSPSTSAFPSSQSNHFFSSLKRSVERDDTAVLLPLFPTFLQSFIKSVQRSHLDLSQILNRDVTSEMRVRVAATYFLTNCLSGPLAFSMSTSESKRHIMETRLGLFQAMTEEGYLDSEQSDAKVVLQSEIEFAISGLQRDDARDACLEILTTILKQDFDLINPVASRILGVLSRLPPSSFHSCDSFLSSLLGFHCKTRTIQVHIHGLVDCLASTSGSVAVSCGPLFASAEYAKELHQAIRLFLTPSQIPHVVKTLTDTLKQLWGLAKLTDSAESDEMVTDTTPAAPSDIADPATALSLLTRLIDKVFSAIAMLDSTTQLYLQDLRVKFLKGDVLRQLVSQLETASTQEESSRIQIGIRAILQLGYCVDKLSKVWELSLEPADNEPQESLTRVLELKQVDPELLLEAATVMLNYVSSSPATTASSPPLSGSCGTVVSLLLDHVEQNIEAAISNQTLWSGQAAYLPSPSHLVVALVDLLLSRWLYVLEYSAPDECLQRLGKLIIRLSEIPITALEPVEPTGVAATSGTFNTRNQFNVADVVWNTFPSGEFWEMRRLRVALMSTVVELTAEIDIFSSTPALLNPQTLRLVSHDALVKHVACYRSMLYFPLEYFTRTSKPIISARAITLDSMITAAATKATSCLPEKEAVEWRLVVRTIIDRTMTPEALVKFPGVLEHLVGTVCQPCVNPSSHHLELERVTLKILSEAFSVLAMATRDSDSVRHIFQNYVDVNVSALKGFEVEAINCTRVRSLFSLLDAFVQGTRYSGVDSGARTLLDVLHKQLETWLTAQLDQILNPLSGEDDETLTKACIVIDGWRTSTKFRRWVGDFKDPIPFSAADLLPSLSRLLGRPQVSQNPTVATLGIAVFRLLLEVLQDSSNDGIESAIACFILLYRFKSENEELSHQLMDSLSGSLRQWSADQYSAAVGLVSDFSRLSSSEKTPAHCSNLGTLFHLSAVLIVDAPDGTGKHAHSLLQQSLLAMLRSSQLSGPTDADSLESCFVLVHEATSFIQRVCNEKPSFLRDVEMGHIFTILYRVLTPPSSTPSIIRSSSPSGIPTPSAIYSAITNILINLVRNQRDLLRTHFPDFTQLLCLLLSSLKTVYDVPGTRPGSQDTWRSKLNNKSIELIQSGLPWWVSACGSDPSLKLNEKDARQLNRLLMSLTTKTFGRDVPSRRPRASERTPKAESLASSFSNYATFVLIAYVRTVTDSYHTRSGGLTTLSKSVRRELDEGISELCGMIGENRRDWVYQSLTSDGRGLFKTVWARVIDLLSLAIVHYAFLFDPSVQRLYAAHHHDPHHLEAVILAVDAISAWMIQLT